MARGNSQNYYKRFYATINAKKGTEPFFSMQRVEPADYVVLPGEARSKTNPKMVCYEERKLFGILAKIELKQKEFEGDTIESIEVTLRDHKVREDYVVKTGLESNMGRNLINALLNLTDFSGDLSISLYVNRDGFNTMSVNLNNEWAGFKLKYDEYKPLIRTYIGKNEKQETDWSKVTEYFKKQVMTDLLPRFNEYLQFANADIREQEEVQIQAPRAPKKQAVEKEEPTPDILGQIREEAKERKANATSGSEDTESDLPF